MDIGKPWPGKNEPYYSLSIKKLRNLDIDY